MAQPSSASALSGASLFSLVRSEFQKFPDFRDLMRVEIAIEDFFMSGLAIFALKFPSLLQFEEEIRQRRHFSNLKGLFAIERVPSDTHMRTVIDNYLSEVFRPIFQAVFERARRHKVLEDFAVWESTYCLAVDGTGYFHSDSVHCEQCLEKRHKSTGEKSFHHQMLAGSIIHPDKATVIPVCPEPIRNHDGSSKNDCEQNAMKRFLIKYREDHPKLKTVLLTDALHATLPCLDLLQKLDMDFILAVKPGSHEKLFEALDSGESQSRVYHFTDEDEIGDHIKKRRYRHYRFTNGVLLNHQSTIRSVNFLELWETLQWVDKDGETQEQKRHFSWVTNYSLYESSSRQIAHAARARWKIENETFNTLKNQGYEFEHNFGHGYKNLSSNFAHLMMLQFLIDQLQEMKCKIFRAAHAKVFHRTTRLWQKLKAIYEFFPIEFSNWTEFLSFFNNPSPWMKNPNSS